MYKYLGGLKPPVDKKLNSNAYCIGKVVGFYNSNELGILFSIPYPIRDEDDGLLPTSVCSSLKDLRQFCRNSPLILCLPSPLAGGRIRDVGRVGRK